MTWVNPLPGALRAKRRTGAAQVVGKAAPVAMRL